MVNNLFACRLEANAMPVALSFSLLIVIFTFGIIRSTGLLTKEIKLIERDQTINKIIDHIEDSILAGGCLVQPDRLSENVSVYNVKKKGTVRVVHSGWGVYEVISIQVPERQFLNRNFMICNSNIQGYGVVESKEKIRITGETKVAGKLYTHVKPQSSRIEGYYNNADLTKAEFLTAGFGEYQIEGKEIRIPSDGEYMNNLPQMNQTSFSDPAKMITSSANVVLNGNLLKGKILLNTPGEVRIAKESKVADIIIIAGKIEIAEGFCGALQCISSGDIEIGKNVRLEFPSALIIQEHTGGTIHISEGSLVSGVIGTADFQNRKKVNALSKDRDLKVVSDRINKRSVENDRTDPPIRSASVQTIQKGNDTNWNSHFLPGAIVKQAGSENLLIIEEKAMVEGEICFKGMLINAGLIRGILGCSAVGSVTSSGQIYSNAIVRGQYNFTGNTFTSSLKNNTIQAGQNPGIPRIARRLT